MKTILGLLLSSSMFLISSHQVKAGELQEGLTVTSAIPVSVLCWLDEETRLKVWTPSDEMGCPVAYMLSSISITGLSLKEIQEIKPDVLFYESEGVASPALLSVIEKIQMAADKENKELSFEAIINLLATI